MKKRTMDLNIREPRITGVSLVARNILLLTVQEGAIVGGVQEPYRPQEGETLEQDKNIPSLVYIVKDGKRIGVKVEDRQKGVQRFPFEKVIGEPLDENAADDVLSYSINGRHPFAVWRKSKPNNVADPAPFSGYTKRHCLYLVLCEEVMSGTTISLTFCKGLFDREEYTFSFVESECFSEAVQVSQIGYRSDDVGKKAYLSQWLGLGGGVDYDDVRTFYLLDGTGKRVFAGDVKLQHTGAIEPMGAQEISSLCPVYEMDFSAFRGEGVFRVLVPGIGCSFPFSLGEDTWLKGFYANMNGLYCQRSGIKTGAPYTEFERPRCYHPDDGQVVYQSKCSLFESGNGLNCYGTDVNNFENLVRKGTEERVENAWGGYFDACDWDRRIQHLKATRLMCELFLMFPDYFADLKLTIPESGTVFPMCSTRGCTIWIFTSGCSSQTAGSAAVSSRKSTPSSDSAAGRMPGRHTPMRPIFGPPTTMPRRRRVWLLHCAPTVPNGRRSMHSPRRRPLTMPNGRTRKGSKARGTSGRGGHIRVLRRSARMLHATCFASRARSGTRRFTSRCATIKTTMPALFTGCFQTA